MNIRKWWEMNTMNVYVRFHPWSVYYTSLVSHPTENYWQGRYNPKTKRTTLPKGKHRPWWKRIYLELGHKVPTKGTTMNEEITNPQGYTDAAQPAPKLTDAEVEAILASKPIFVTEGEAEGETIH